MQDRVFDAADILVYRHPVARSLAIERSPIVVRRGKAQEVPRGVDKGIHRVGFAPGRAAAAGAGYFSELLAFGERRTAFPGKRHVSRKRNRQLILRHRNRPALLAIHNWNRRAPVTLARNPPVAKAIADRLFSPALLFKELRDFLSSFGGREIAEGAALHHDPVIDIRFIQLFAAKLRARRLDDDPNR